MDAAVILVIALILYCRYRGEGSATTVSPAPKTKAVQIKPNPTLNPEMYHEEKAFMVIANVLGFS